MTTGTGSLSFFSCWLAAGDHLAKYVDDGIDSWCRSHPYVPFLGHMMFRIGNQLFFVRVEDEEGAVRGPGSVEGLVYQAKMANGVPCILTMKRLTDNKTWKASKRGWGLIDAVSKKVIHPKSMATDIAVEMTPWELQDVAVQAVRQHLEMRGIKLMSWQSDPHVDPSIWFIGPDNRSEWVVVRALRSAAAPASRPDNWAATAQKCAAVSPAGHYAPVWISAAYQQADVGETKPLVRGQPLQVRFDGFS